MDHGAAEEKEGKHGQNHGEHGDDRPAQHLVDAQIDKPAKGQIAQQPFVLLVHIFPDPVKDHDRVVQGIAGNGQQGGDDQQIDFLVKQPADSQHRQHIVKGGDGGTDPETQVEPEGQVDDYADH